MSYAEDLKHPRWQERRLRVLERAGFRCERCSSDERQLHAHHKAYLRGNRLWDYPDDMLECLCDSCHDFAHAQKSRIDQQLARHPSSELPILSRLFDKLGECWKADPGPQRVDAINRLNDELDALQDFDRGPGGSV